MRIILLNLRSDYTGFPLGLAYLSACLKKAGFKDIKGIDLGIDSEKNLLEYIEKADILAMSVMTRNYFDAIRISKKAKKINPGLKIIVGGPHPTVCSEDMMQPSIDFIVIGEGEITIVELLKNLSNNKQDLSEIKGVWYRSNNKWNKNKKRDFIKNLDSLPFPDHEIFQINRYNFGMLKHFYKPPIPIITSRSCLYNCANCQPALSKIAGSFRQRSIKNVIEEIEFLIKKYRYRKFGFNDNDITTDKKWIKEFCREIIRKKLKIEWGANARATNMDEDVMKLLKKSGFKMFFMGVESGSQEILDNVLIKGITIERVKEVVNNARKVGISPQCSFMIGIPGETKEQMQQTLDLAVSLKPDIAFICPVVPYPETRYEKILKDKGWLLSNSHFEYGNGISMSYRTDYWDSSFLEEMKKKCVNLFNKRGYIEIDKTSTGTMVFYNVRSNKKRLFILLGKEIIYFNKDKDIRLHVKNVGIIFKNLFL
ncbi:MAG: radical SAM protein [archaeon]